MSVRFTEQFSHQIEKALTYIRERSPSGAENVALRITEAIDLLADQPRAGRMTTRKGVRRLNLAPYPYIVLYRILSDDDVIVLRFTHSARKSA